MEKAGKEVTCDASGITRRYVLEEYKDQGGTEWAINSER